MTGPDLYLVLGAVVTLLGAARLLTTRAPLRQVIALNVAGAGTLLVLVALGSDGAGTADPVLQALALTGIVITVAVTGLALVLVRRIEADGATATQPTDPAAAGGAGDRGGPDQAPGDLPGSRGGGRTDPGGAGD